MKESFTIIFNSALWTCNKVSVIWYSHTLKVSLHYTSQNSPGSPVCRNKTQLKSSCHSSRYRGLTTATECYLVFRG